MSAGRAWWGPRIAGLGLLGIGVAALLATMQIPGAGNGWAPEGPRFIPLVVSVGLIVLALAFLLRTVWHPDIELARFAAAEAAATNWSTPVSVVGALVVYAFAMVPMGYALATAGFFVVVARILGSRRLARDAVAGVLLGVVLGYAFTRWLGVRLPVGPWGV